MCGRIVYIWDPVTGTLVKTLDDGALGDDKIRHVLEKKRHNVPPASHLPVFVDRAGATKVDIARWGFPIPQRPNGVFNTRIETAPDSPMWRGMLGKTHCVFPVKGFYEWRHDEGKQPYYIHRKDGGNMLLAGLAGIRDVKGERKLCASIVTCAPNPLVAKLHDRMPVILEREQLDAWLRPTSMDDALGLAQPAGNVLTMHPVGPGVNSTKNDAPELMAATGPEESA